MNIVCCDLEGVFVPEIWINVAEKTGIDALRLTTRDISDYDVLMKKRLDILKQNQLKLSDIQAVITSMSPLPGAKAFLDGLREKTQVIIVSDTFDQFAGPLMAKLGRPTLFCNTLVVDDNDCIIDYRLRQQDGKKHVVDALKSLNFSVYAMGDSYNDISMLKQADAGFLFRPPENVIQEFPQFPVCTEYSEISKRLSEKRVL
ncbi:MAG: Phosphoserine phosphatase/homoserine phosphotransferase bifunctional protein [Candidatus Magnetoglobus multicellularis str. Araruama]|uniref:phosphoserine phosphatase n=1 Tax=Candidatus Magnetoglobus multicellularis str. Araruama TaxID=890399 RepID=A0A1V1PF97_9BACT|nr:MAG: Phosphoserine phosphatase/homoserine phosphotransferase bifunctional protein [Candidatus Magnetoglobus multicellularis str. Araruama]